MVESEQSSGLIGPLDEIRSELQSHFSVQRLAPSLIGIPRSKIMGGG